jgi:hypothetical protein
MDVIVGRIEIEHMSVTRVFVELWMQDQDVHIKFLVGTLLLTYFCLARVPREASNVLQLISKELLLAPHIQYCSIMCQNLPVAPSHEEQDDV